MTFTVCAVDQFDVVNVNLVFSTVRSVPAEPDTVTVTSSVGCVSSTTVYVPLLFSSTISVAVLSATPRVSSSTMVTVTASATSTQSGSPRTSSNRNLKSSSAASSRSSSRTSNARVFSAS